MFMELHAARLQQTRILEQGAALFDAGQLRVVVSEVLPLQDAARAHQLIERGGVQGKIVLEGKQLWGYDKKNDKFIISVVIKGMDILMGEIWFTSKNICVIPVYSDISKLEKAPYKMEVEFKSPDIMLYKTIVNNNIIKTDTFTRIK